MVKKTKKKKVNIRNVSIRKNKRVNKRGFLKKKPSKRIELSSKEFKINLERLQKDVRDAYVSMKKILPEAIKEMKVTKFGNAGHIIVPKEYIGKKATVIVKKNS